MAVAQNQVIYGPDPPNHAPSLDALRYSPILGPPRETPSSVRQADRWRQQLGRVEVWLRIGTAVG